MTEKSGATARGWVAETAGLLNPHIWKIGNPDHWDIHALDIWLQEQKRGQLGEDPIEKIELERIKISWGRIRQKKTTDEARRQVTLLTKIARQNRKAWKWGKLERRRKIQSSKVYETEMSQDFFKKGRYETPTNPRNFVSHSWRVDAKHPPDP